MNTSESMKIISYTKVAQHAGISRQSITNILAGRRRPSWKVAKRLVAVIPNSSIEQWMEAPTETLRQIIAEYRQSQTTEERTAS